MAGDPFDKYRYKGSTGDDPFAAYRYDGNEQAVSEPEAPKKRYSSAFAEDVAKRQAEAQPALTPEQELQRRGLLTKAMSKAPSFAKTITPIAEEVASDILKTPYYAARQALPAASGTLSPLVEGALNIAGAPKAARYVRGVQQKMEEVFAPESSGEAAMGAGLRVGGAIAPFAAAATAGAPIAGSAALTGLLSQSENGSLVQFLGDKLDSDVLKSIAESKYKTPADMVLDIALGTTFGSLDNIYNAAKNTSSARAALQAQGAEPFIRTASLIQQGIESGELDAKAFAPYLDAATKMARQAQGGKASNVIAGLGASATQFGKNVAQNVRGEAELLGGVGRRVAEEATLPGARVSVPKRFTLAQEEEMQFNRALDVATAAGDDTTVEHLLKVQDMKNGLQDLRRAQAAAADARDLDTVGEIGADIAQHEEELQQMQTSAPKPHVTKTIESADDPAGKVVGPEAAGDVRVLGESGAGTAYAFPAQGGPPPLVLPEVTADSKSFLQRAPGFGKGESNEYIPSISGLEGFRLFRNVGYGMDGGWHVIDPRVKGAEGIKALAAWNKKDAEKAFLDYIRWTQEKGYMLQQHTGAAHNVAPIIQPGVAAQAPAVDAGTAYAFPAQLGLLSKLGPEGKRLAGVAATGVGAYSLSQSDDPMLQKTGKAFMGLAALSTIWPQLKTVAAFGGKRAAGLMEGTALGRKALDAISLDIRTDPLVRDVINAADADLSRLNAQKLEIQSRMAKLGPEAERVISDLVEKETIETAQLSEPHMKAAIALADQIAKSGEDIGQRMVDEKLMALKTFEKRKGTYLPRRYAKYEGEGATKNVNVKYRGVEYSIDPVRIRNDELTNAERAALGEIREAGYRVADLFDQGGRSVVSAKLFRQLSEIPGAINPEYVDAVKRMMVANDFASAGKRTTVAGKQARAAFLEAKQEALDISARFKGKKGGEYTTLPDTPAYGALAGAVVRKDVADYLIAVPTFSRDYNKLMHWWKASKTIYNLPPTHINNFISNIWMGQIGGLPIHEQAVRLPKAMADIKAYGPATKYLAEAGVLERGLPLYGDQIFKGTARDETALRKLMSTTRPETRAALEEQGLKPMGKAEQKVRTAAAKISGWYSIGDGVFRVALFQKLTKQGMAAEDAAQEVMRVFPGYDTRSPLLQKARTVSPFLMYPVKYIPTALNLIVENPWRWAVASALYGTVDQMSRRMYGAIDERSLPPNQRRDTGYLMPGVIQTDVLGFRSKNPAEHPVFDIARLTPFGGLSGGSAPGTTLGAISENLPPVISVGGPVPDIATRLVANTDPYTGQKFIRGSDEPMDVAKKLLTGTTQNGRFVPGMIPSLALPTVLSYHLPNVAKDLMAGDTEAAKLDAMGILGFRPKMVKRGQQAQREQLRHRDVMQEINTDFRKSVLAAKTLDARKEIAAEFRGKIQRENQKYVSRMREAR
jgi:hypothetical protein